MDWRSTSLLAEEVHAFASHPGASPVVVREGDILFVRRNGCCPTLCIAACQQGRAHVGIALKNPDSGRLFFAHCALSTTSIDDASAIWPATDGRLVLNGAHGVLLGPKLDKQQRLWLLRPREPWTRTQLDAATRFFQARVDEGASAAPEQLRTVDRRALPNLTYERHMFSVEMVAALCHWPNATSDRFTCAEFVADMLCAAGRWPPNVPTSVSLVRLQKLVPGACISVF